MSVAKLSLKQQLNFSKTKCAGTRMLPTLCASAETKAQLAFSQGEVRDESIRRSSRLAATPLLKQGLVGKAAPSRGSRRCAGTAVLSASSLRARGSFPCAAAVARHPQPSAQGMEQRHCNGPSWVRGCVQLWAVTRERNYLPPKQIPLFHPQPQPQVSFFLHGSVDFKLAEHTCCVLFSHS